ESTSREWYTERTQALFALFQVTKVQQSSCIEFIAQNEEVLDTAKNLFEQQCNKTWIPNIKSYIGDVTESAFVPNTAAKTKSTLPISTASLENQTMCQPVVFLQPLLNNTVAGNGT